MSSIYEEVEIEDLDFDKTLQVYSYPCPCGDRFSIHLEDMWDGEDIATCPSCTLTIRIIFDEGDLPELREDDDDDNELMMKKTIQENEVSSGAGTAKVGDD